MNAIATDTVTTADTGEEIEGITVLRDFHMNGGYDWMELIGEHGWAVIPSWGSDGWDLGQWPLVMVAGIRTADSVGNLFGVATYCEGDVTCTFFRSKSQQHEAITQHAHYWWQNGTAQGPADLPATAADLPDRDRRPYTGWTD